MRFYSCLIRLETGVESSVGAEEVEVVVGGEGGSFEMPVGLHSSEVCVGVTLGK